MAKKKQKQNNHSSKKSSNKHKDSPRSRLEFSARESYRERTKCIRHDETLTPELREGLDYDPIRQKRRIRATIATMEEERKEYSTYARMCLISTARKRNGSKSMHFQVLHMTMKSALHFLHWQVQSGCLIRYGKATA